MSIAIVTGCLAPYVARLHNTYTETHRADLTVFQCTESEPGRKWHMPAPNGFRLKSLAGLRLHRSEYSHIYLNPGIIFELARLRPDLILLEGFSPTMVLAGLFALATRTAFGISLEGSRDSDPGETSRLHRFLRRFMASRADLAISTSEGGREMQEHWGMPRERIVIIPHCGSWDPPEIVPSFHERSFDLLFCGTLNERKNPMFFADVVEQLVRDGLKPRVLVVGDGPLRGQFEDRLRSIGIDYRFEGYLQKDAIIKAYQSSKLLLFTTTGDTWGLVANEAIMCGTPIITSPHAVSSQDLVEPFGTGLVLDLDVGTWAAHIRTILQSPQKWQSFLARRKDALERYSLASAVSSLASAFSLKHGPRRTARTPN